MGRERSFLSVTHAPCGPACLYHQTAPYIPRPSVLHCWRMLLPGRQGTAPHVACNRVPFPAAQKVQELGCTVVKQDEWMVEVRHARLLGLEHVDVGGDALHVRPVQLHVHKIGWRVHPRFACACMHSPSSLTLCSIPGRFTILWHPHTAVGRACQATSCIACMRPALVPWLIRAIPQSFTWPGMSSKLFSGSREH